MSRLTAAPEDGQQLSTITHSDHGAHSSIQPDLVGDEVRWEDASCDLDFPPVPYPSCKVFSGAGEPMLQRLAQRHYERLVDSCIGHLFPLAQERRAAGVSRTADFFIEATGGPARFTTSHGHTNLRTRHFPFTIDEAARDVWLAQMLLTFDDVGFPDEFRLEFWNWIEALSIRMINRRTMSAKARRYPLAEASITLSPYMTTGRRPFMCPR